MAAVAEVGSSLLTKCLDFCQALSNQGQVFNFSVAIGPDFIFSLDTRRKERSTVAKKKASPSTVKRNARRKEEYPKRKNKPSSVNNIEELEVVSDAPKCDQCNYKAASEKGLRQHQRMKHKPSMVASSENSENQTSPECEILREEELKVSLNISQPSGTRDDEISSVDADLSLLDATLVLPHYCGPNLERVETISEKSVFACGDCLHLWRTREEVQNCSCSTLHDCLPYCLYVDILSKDCTVT